ncbi:hypothetical protein ACX80Z_12500 [Arthrobacter sp. TMT4-20]
MYLQLGFVGDNGSPGGRIPEPAGLGRRAWPLTSFAAARTRDDSLPAARQRAAKTS